MPRSRIGNGAGRAPIRRHKRSCNARKGGCALGRQQRRCRSSFACQREPRAQRYDAASADGREAPFAERRNHARRQTCDPICSRCVSHCATRSHRAPRPANSSVSLRYPVARSTSVNRDSLVAGVDRFLCRPISAASIDIEEAAHLSGGARGPQLIVGSAVVATHRLE